MTASKARKKIRRKVEFYIYRIFDGLQTLYIGKGTGKRLQCQKRRFNADGQILEMFSCEREAYDAERRYIAQYKPTENKNCGGAGGFATEKKMSRAEIAAERAIMRDYEEIEAVGTRRYAARLLLKKIDERNAHIFGLSIVDVSRWREVANGPRC